jgi:4-amino-4-deoxy-L-arabinose transferase-like glycosyltransferase
MAASALFGYRRRPIRLRKTPVASTETSLATERAPPWSLVLVVAATMVALWTLTPSIVTSSPPRDTVEALYWGLSWRWTTPKHPPLAPAVIETLIALTGRALWPVYFLGAACIAAAILLVIRFGQDAFGRTHGVAMGLLSATSLLLFPLGYEFNPNVLLVLGWAALLLAGWRCIVEDTWTNWLTLGLIAGFGGLAKYSMAFPVAGFVAAYCAHEGVAWLRRPWKPFAAAAIATAVMSPHLLAAWREGFVTLHLAARDVRWEPERAFSLRAGAETLEFLLVLAVASIPALLIAPWRGGALRASTRPGDAGRATAYVLWSVGVPFALLLLSGIAGSRLRAPWAMPFSLMLGPLLVALWPAVARLGVADETMRARQGLAAGVMALQLMGFAAYFSAAALGAPRNPLREHVDGRAVTALALDYWGRHRGGALPFVMGIGGGALERQVVGSISYFAPERPSAFQSFWVHRPVIGDDPRAERVILERHWPWIRLDDLARTGGIAVMVGPEPFRWRRLGLCLARFESAPLPVGGRRTRPLSLWLAELVPSPIDGGDCPPAPLDFRAAAGLPPAGRRAPAD